MYSFIFLFVLYVSLTTQLSGFKKMPTRNRRRNSQHCGGSKKTQRRTRRHATEEGTRNTVVAVRRPQRRRRRTTNQPSAKLPKPKPKPKPKTKPKKTASLRQVVAGAAVGVVAGVAAGAAVLAMRVAGAGAAVKPVSTPAPAALRIACAAVKPVSTPESTCVQKYIGLCQEIVTRCPNDLVTVYIRCMMTLHKNYMTGSSSSSTKAHSNPSTDFLRNMQQHIDVMMQENRALVALVATKPNQCPEISDDAKHDMKTVVELLEREYHK